MSLVFYDPDSLSSYDIPTFLIKLSLPRVQESVAAEVGMPRNTRENMSIPGNVFLIVNMIDEIVKNYTIIQEIWQHHRESLMMSRMLRKEGIEKSGSEEPLQSKPFTLLFSKSEEKKSRRQISLMSMTNHVLVF